MVIIFWTFLRTTQPPPLDSMHTCSNYAFIQGTYLYVTDARISLTRMLGLHLTWLFDTGNGEGILLQYLFKQSQGLAMLITKQILGVSLHVGHHLAVILLQLVKRC